MSSMDSVSRLAKIIEDSVRGTQDETQKKVNNNNNNTTKFTNNKCKTKIAAVKNEDFGFLEFCWESLFEQKNQSH